MNPLDELEVKLAGIRIRVPPYFRINERGHREDVKGYTRTLRIGDPGGIDDDLTPYERRALANVDPSQVAMIDKIRRNASALKSMGPLERLEVKADVNPFEPDVSQGLPATPDEANTVSKFLSPEQQWGAQTPTPSAIDRLIDQAQVVEIAPGEISEQVREAVRPQPEISEELKDLLLRLDEANAWYQDPDLVDQILDEIDELDVREATVTWGVSEWADEGTTAYLRGYEADAWQRMGGGAPGEPWADYDWTVKATSDVSEWPELYDSGSANSLSAAQKAAEAALRRAAAKAPRTNPTTGELNQWARSTTS